MGNLSGVFSIVLHLYWGEGHFLLSLFDFTVDSYSESTLEAEVHSFFLMLPCVFIRVGCLLKSPFEP